MPGDIHSTSSAMTRRLYLIAVQPAKIYNRPMRAKRSGTLRRLTAGGGIVVSSGSGNFSLELGAQTTGYGLAQLDDYHHLPRADFQWKPPLHLSLAATASLKEPKGTLGFGFWNDPFSLSLGQAGAERRFPASPQAAWFFHGSPPNDLQLAPPIPGHGWKAAVLRSPQLPTLALAPAALIAIVTAQVPLLKRLVMKAAIGFVQADETILGVDLDRRHHYALTWDVDRVQFFVDNQPVLVSEITPLGPLGFVAWIDNQYAIASPRAGFRFGMIPTSEAQALEISDLRINNLHFNIKDDHAP